MNHGALEHDIRSLPGVLACQFTPTDVFVLVEPSADVAAVTAAVEGVLAAAAEARRVAVIGGTTAAAGAGVAWFRKKHALVLGATAASFVAAAAAAAVTGAFTAEPTSHRAAAAPAAHPPAHSPATTTTTTTTTTTLPAASPSPPATTPAAVTPPTTNPPGPQIIRLVLPAPLPAIVGTTLPPRVPATTTPTTSRTPPTTKPPPPTQPPPVPVCDPAKVVSAFRFTINGRPAATLHRQLQEGDTVMAFFTVAHGCTGVPVALVSHTSPDPVFIKDHVSQQRVFQAARASLDAGDHVLGPVVVPRCNFQVDFAALAQGSQPGFTYSSGVGGTSKCSQPEHHGRTAPGHGPDVVVADDNTRH